MEALFSSELRGVVMKKIVLVIVTAVKTSSAS
jgi:hypothetical protein